MQGKLKAGILVVLVVTVLCLQISGVWTASIQNLPFDKFPFDQVPLDRIPWITPPEDIEPQKSEESSQTDLEGIPYVSIDEESQQETPYEYGFPQQGYNEGLSMTPLPPWGLQTVAIVALALFIYVFVIRRKTTKKKSKRRKSK